MNSTNVNLFCQVAVTISKRLFSISEFVSYKKQAAQLAPVCIAHTSSSTGMEGPFMCFQRLQEGTEIYFSPFLIL